VKKGEGCRVRSDVVMGGARLLNPTMQHMTLACASKERSRQWAYDPTARKSKPTTEEMFFVAIRLARTHDTGKQGSKKQIGITSEHHDGAMAKTYA
jgi:hypothetical protein